jgi:hypothetical protein
VAKIQQRKLTIRDKVAIERDAVATISKEIGGAPPPGRRAARRADGRGLDDRSPRDGLGRDDAARPSTQALLSAVKDAAAALPPAELMRRPSNP